MAKFHRFEELDCWQRSRELTKRIYSISNEYRFSKDYSLSNQIRRAGISIMSNIAEGFERNGNAEFIQFLSIAKGSIGEVRSQLWVALDQEYINKETYTQLAEMAEETGRRIGALVSYLRKSGMKGAKFFPSPKTAIRKPVTNSELGTRNPELHFPPNPEPGTRNPER
jgi:four helix bundle protein